MKRSLIGFHTLSSHPFPASLTQSTRGGQVQQIVTMLEAHLCGDADKVLLLVDNRLTGEVVLISLYRLLRYTRCQHLLVVGSAARTRQLAAHWHQLAYEDDGETHRFVMTTTPQQAQDASVCLTTVFDLQRSTGMERAHPLFSLFDLVVFADMPVHPGPAWCQLLDLFTVSSACVIGVSDLVSVEEGALLFAEVIDTRNMSERPGSSA